MRSVDARARSERVAETTRGREAPGARRARVGIGDATKIPPALTDEIKKGKPGCRRCGAGSPTPDPFFPFPRRSPRGGCTALSSSRSSASSPSASGCACTSSSMGRGAHQLPHKGRVRARRPVTSGAARERSRPHAFQRKRSASVAPDRHSYPRRAHRRARVPRGAWARHGIGVQLVVRRAPALARLPDHEPWVVAAKRNLQVECSVSYHSLWSGRPFWGLGTHAAAPGGVAKRGS